MRKLAVVFLAAFAALGLAHEARAQQCGLPDARPLWLDYTDGTVPFSAEVFGKPGLITATGGANLPPQLCQPLGELVDRVCRAGDAPDGERS